MGFRTSCLSALLWTGLTGTVLALGGAPAPGLPEAERSVGCEEIERCVLEALPRDSRYGGFSDPAGFLSLPLAERTRVARAFESCVLGGPSGLTAWDEGTRQFVEEVAWTCSTPYLAPSSGLSLRQQPGECTGLLKIAGGAGYQLKFSVCAKDEKSAINDAKLQPTVRDQMIQALCEPLGCEKLNCPPAKNQRNCTTSTKPQTPKLDYDPKATSCVKLLDGQGKEIPCGDKKAGQVLWECTIVVKTFGAFDCFCECK